MKKLFTMAVCFLSMAYAQADELLLCDFESYEPGTALTMRNLYGETTSTAVVEADPQNPDNKVLHVKNTSWNTFVEFVLPDGLNGQNFTDTYQAVEFKIYRPESDGNDYMQMAVLLGTDKLFWDEGYPNQGAKGTWLDKHYDLTPFVNEATTLCLGYHNDQAEYYIDDIRLIGATKLTEGSVRWTGAESGVWDTVTPNFADATAETPEEAAKVAFANGNDVTFSDVLTYKAGTPDVPDPDDPDVPQPVETVVYEYSYEGVTAYPWYSMNNGAEKVEDGCLVIDNATEGLADYNVQYFVADQVPTEVDGDYTLRFTMKATADGTLNCNVGNWSGSASCKVSFTSEWQTVETEVKAVPCTPAHIVFQSGSFVGTIYVKDVKVIKKETPGAVKVPVTVTKYDFEDDRLIGGWGNGSTREIVEGSHDGSKCEKFYNPSVVNSWEVQGAINFDEALTEGELYYLHFWAKADIEGDGTGDAGAAFQGPNYSGRGDFPGFTLTGEWQEYTLKTTVTGTECTRLCLNLGKVAGSIYFDDVEIYYMKEEIPADPTDTTDPTEPTDPTDEPTTPTDQTVTLAETVTTGNVTFSNSTIRYTLESATGAEAIEGAGRLVVSGGNDVTLNVDNRLEQGTLLTDGRLTMTKYVSDTQFGTQLTAEGGALEFSYNTNANAYPTVSTAIGIAEDKELDIYTSRYCYWMSPVSGSGTLNVYAGGERTFVSNAKGAQIPDWSAFSGTVNLYPYEEAAPTAGFYGLVLGHGGMTFNPEAPAEKANGTFANARLVMHEGTTLACESGTRAFRIGELQMEPQTRICGYYKASTPKSYFIVGGLDTDALLAGQIAPADKNGAPYASQGVGLIKEGAGTYTLTGNNNMITAGIRILAGRLLVANDKAEAADNKLTGATGCATEGTQTFVFTNGVLGGTGSIGGDVDVYGKLEPGCDGIGTLTLKNYAEEGKGVQLYLRPASVLEFEIESVENHDRLDVDGNLIYYNITEDFTESDVKPIVRPLLAEGFSYKKGEEFVLITAKGKGSLNDEAWDFDVELPEGKWMVEERDAEGGYQLVLKAADVTDAIKGATAGRNAVYAEAGTVYVYADGAEEISIYSAAGQLLKTVKAKNGLNAIPAAKGVLIVKAGDMTGKVVNE